MGFYAKKPGYKKPDLNAPRFRRTGYQVLTRSLFKKFKAENPTIPIDFETYKTIVLAFNRKVAQKIVEHREGVEFPEQLGYVFIGTCPRAKKQAVDPAVSSDHNVHIKFKNWDSNQYVCKIFYSNYGTKYKFAHREMWYFVPSRALKRAASASFSEKWNKFIKVSPISKISNFYKQQKGYKGIKVKKHDYNNRRVDFSDTQPE